jgi:hypothetical protein
LPAALPGLLPILTAGLLAGASPVWAAAPELPSLDVEGTEFKVTLTDGRVLRSAELVGTTLTISTSSGMMRLRIDAVERDGEMPVWLHSFSTEAPDGSRQPLCDPGPDGGRQGFPLAGRGRSDGTMEPAEPGIFEIVCTSGARGKCVRFGYLPWVSAAMRGIYDACVRLVRADYCGDGEATIREACGSTFTTTVASSSLTSIQRMNSRRAGPPPARSACVTYGSKRILARETGRFLPAIARPSGCHLLGGTRPGPRRDAVRPLLALIGEMSTVSAIEI